MLANIKNSPQEIGFDTNTACDDCRLTLGDKLNEIRKKQTYLKHAIQAQSFLVTGRFE